MFLVNSRLEDFRCVLILRLGRSYSEVTITFLPSSLTKFHSFTLVRLYLPTCVSLRYGPTVLSLNGLFWATNSPGTGKSPGNPIILQTTKLRPPFRKTDGGRNINRLSIVVTFRSVTKVRLTLGWLSLPRKPWVFGVRGCYSNCGYSCQHSHFSSLHPTLQSSFAAKRTLLYHAITKVITSLSSVLSLSPVNFRCKTS